MDGYHVFLPAYSVGVDCYQEIPQITKQYGKRAVVIGGKTAIAKSQAALLKDIAGSDVEIIDFIWYGGNATYENVEKLQAMSAVQQADMIFAAGGGRAVDTCKVVGDKLDKPLFTFPTVSSNCAGCTCISVMYNADGTFKGYYYPKRPPLHTFINTKIIAESPEKLLWAGIGDALSKEFEVVLASRGKKLSHAPLLGAQLSRACTKPLLELGQQAMQDCQNNVPSYELQQVALDIIMSTGLVSNLVSEPSGRYYYNSSLAHAVYNGSTVIERCETHLHGEIVSFGVLCLLTYDGDIEMRNRICEFNKSMSLPICLADLDLTREDLPKIAAKASTLMEWTCTPEPMTQEGFIQAIIDCDEYGRQQK